MLKIFNDGRMVSLFQINLPKKHFRMPNIKNVLTRVNDEETLSENKAVFEEETLSHDDDDNHDYDEETLTHNKKGYVSDDEILDENGNNNEGPINSEISNKKTGRNSYFMWKSSKKSMQ